MTEINTFNPSVVAQGLPSPSVPDPVTASQYAQERFLAVSTNTANPNFLLAKDRNRLVENGGSISRGYIRRSDINTGDPTSGYRLYFMFNPSDIQRSYIAYLDQAALDPGNALFGSNNMTAAPGILDFSFELLFDRQLEVAQDPENSGTKVDYDYFDIVVRGVVPDSADTGNAIPDNGIMMVNPHNIVVVFGPDLSVQGRVTNAGVSFEKFSNSMVPTRLRIAIQMKALYIGPVQTIPNYSLYNSEVTSSATIPYENTVDFQIVPSEVQYFINTEAEAAANAAFPVTGSGIVSGTTDMTTFAHNFLKALNVPDSEPNVQAIISWERAEGGMPWNNPLNTTETMPGATYGKGHIGHYVSLDQAVEASVKTITNGLYGMILTALKDGTSICGVVNAITSSPWGTQHGVINDITNCP